MKKVAVALVVSIILLGFGFAKISTAEQNATPPLLMQQNQVQPVPVPSPGIPPTPNNVLPIPAGPATPPPPPGPARIPIIQTIPAQMLLDNLQQAVSTTMKLNKLLTAGKVWIMRTPNGEIEIKGGVLYQGVVVTVLHFDSIDGRVLPLGINLHAYQNKVQIQSIESQLSVVVGNLEILPVAEFMEPEACWSFPVVLDGAIVAHIKVYYDGIHVVQDDLANQEMIFYGQ